MSHCRILVAGIGNIFLGDDAFGVEVARRLMQRPQSPGVRVVDFGIRGLDLTYALLDGYDTAILVDAMPRGGRPGTLYVVESQLGEAGAGGAPSIALDMHDLDPGKVLRLAASLGSPVRRLLVIGCEPQRTGDAEEMIDGLSEPVEAAVEEAVRLAEEYAARLLVDDSSRPSVQETLSPQQSSLGECTWIRTR